MDRVLIQMPDNLQEFLFALPPVQDYQGQMAVGAYQKQRDVDYTVTIRLNEKFRFLESCLQIVTDNVPIVDYSGKRDLVRGEFDCFVEFDFVRAAAVAGPSKRHITDGLGLLIGASPQKWPILASLGVILNPSTDVLVVDSWEGTEKFIRFISDNYPDVTWNMCGTEVTGSELNWFHLVADHKVVIGPASVTTYIAASLKKSVIEIFPNDVMYNLYNNNGIHNYRALVGHASPEVVFPLWEEMQGVGV